MSTTNSTTSLITARPGASLRTSIGEFALYEYCAHLAGRDWSILHTGAVLSQDEEQRFLASKGQQPYGVILWPAAIALAHEVESRAADLRDRTVLELGAGTGLPGLVAAALGARVVQTDRQEIAMAICRDNAVRNDITAVEHRSADWTAWTDDSRYDFILGSDILYAPRMHEPLARIFERNLAGHGCVLLSDPFRAGSMPLLERLEGEGWRIVLSKWCIGEGSDACAVGTYELWRDE